jgi:enterochelin esterase-like enzyme
LRKLAFLLAFTAAAFAQRTVVSPEVLPDHRVTFRISAPKATDVGLQFGDGKPLPLTKGKDGVWSVTIGPVKPEIYSYFFIVDGAKAIDLANPMVSIGQSVSYSLVDVMGNPPRLDQLQEVPHGAVSIHTYPSSVSKTQRGLYVYVPAEYYTQPAKRYPVLYLWHGGGGAEQQWSTSGRAGVILDNLIAQKKAVAMIIVMPNNWPGYPAPGAAPSVTPVNPGATPGGDIEVNYPLLKLELGTEIIPFVAQHYRTLENRESRAMAGISGGAGTVMTAGFGSLDEFAWLAEFSAGIFGGNPANPQHYNVEDFAPGFYKDPSATNRRVKLFYMSCGTDDPRLPFQKEALKEFQDHKINVKFAVFPGAHEWKVWRPSLADFAAMLFK